MAATIRRRLIFPFTRQRDSTECGTTCLAMIFRYYGLSNVQASLRQLAQVGQTGTDLYTLSEIAERFGFRSEGFQLAFESLREISMPCIAHVDGNHFVVLRRADDQHVWIADPGYGKERLTREEFERRWSGVVLTVEPTEEAFRSSELEELLQTQRQRKRAVLKAFYLSLLKPFRAVLLEVLAATGLLHLLGLALPLFTQVIIDEVLITKSQTLLLAILAGMVAILLTQVLLTYVRNVLITQFKVRFELDFFSNFFDHFIRLSQSYFDGFRREDFINRFHENLKLRKILSPAILQSLVDVVFIVVSLAVLFMYEVRLAAVAAGFVLFFVVATIIYSPKLRFLEEKIFYENLKTMGAFLDSLLGMQSIKLLGIEDLKFRQWKRRYTRALNKVLDAEQTQIMLQSMLRGAFFAGQVAVYWIGAFMAFEGALSIGQYFAFVTIFTAIMVSVDSVAVLWFLVTELSVTFTRLNDVFLQEPEQASHTAASWPENGATLRLERVSFSYAGSADEPVLRDINLEISPGERVALVGRNGSGKSTLVKLLVRLYDNYRGRIVAGAVDIRDIPLDVLRERVVMVPQDVYLFTGTIKENILYGNPEASMPAVVQAARLADLHDHVRELFLGYNHMVGEGGGNLSGGLRLKVALARLFLRQMDVLILDESSSVLDVEAERRILENVRNHYPDTTIITIAHRLQTVRSADRILVLDRGRLVEEGPHEELLRQEGLYHRFVHSYVGV